MSDTSQPTPRLLVVDDEKDLRDLIVEGMTLVGAEVFSARDGQEGWEIFQKEQIDLVISDIFMPRMNGIELLNRIKETHTEMPVLLITGYARKLRLEEECTIQPEATIEKPFGLGDLMKHVARHLPGRLSIPNNGGGF